MRADHRFSNQEQILVKRQVGSRFSWATAKICQGPVDNSEELFNFLVIQFHNRRAATLSPILGMVLNLILHLSTQSLQHVFHPLF